MEISVEAIVAGLGGTGTVGGIASYGFRRLSLLMKRQDAMVELVRRNVHYSHTALMIALLSVPEDNKDRAQDLYNRMRDSIEGKVEIPNV